VINLADTADSLTISHSRQLTIRGLKQTDSGASRALLLAVSKTWRVCAHRCTAREELRSARRPRAIGRPMLRSLGDAADACRRRAWVEAELHLQHGRAAVHHCSSRQSLQFGLCAGQARATHSAPQNLATWHLAHVLSLRRAPQPKQHADATSREHAILSQAAMIAALCSAVKAAA